MNTADGERWASLPGPLRTRVDELVLRDREFAAIRALWTSGVEHGGDLRLFNGQVPPWPEAEEAKTTGSALAEHFGLPFHFASPDTPDDEAPRWHDLQRDAWS